MVDCAGHYGNDLALSVFSEVRIVSKSPTEFSPSIGAFMELRSNANLPCLLNLALKIFGDVINDAVFLFCVLMMLFLGPNSSSFKCFY